MAKTQNLGLDVTSDGEDRAFKLWRESLASDKDTSNMQIIDRAFGDIMKDITWDEFLPDRGDT